MDAGTLQLVPANAAHVVFADDYAGTWADGRLLNEYKPFDALMERRAAIKTRASGLKA